MTGKMQELIEEVYRHSSVGGNLHIVLDDWNLGNDSIQFCASEWTPPPESTPAQLAAEKECREMLLGMTLEERVSALAIYDGYLAPAAPGGSSGR